MSDVSILELITGASVIVQLVMALLLLASVSSWMIILRKRSELNETLDQSDKFEDEFWKGGDLIAMYRKLESRKTPAKGVAIIFEAGFREFARLRQHSGMAADQIIEGSRRGMRAALLKETDRLEKSLAMLATIGSISPYVGLFGTVWGIIKALITIAAAGQASIDKVAGPVGEALIMTAIGLAVAVPAVMGYNWLVRRNKTVMEKVRAFSGDLHNVLIAGKR